MKYADAPRTKIAVDAMAARMRRTLLALAEQCRSLAARSLMPGRAAGSIASIDLSRNLRRDGTRAAFSCPMGSASDFWALRISSMVQPLNGVFPVSANHSVAPNE